jgi:hypothetical protein
MHINKFIILFAFAIYIHNTLNKIIAIKLKYCLQKYI